ncbi:MAG: vitamin K epoxide reductase family protein [Candidatus Levybacteria bacterium]|nr:vitamin K epoxide reductase family protein [Candidatus Levybacteria bacterium]
MKKIILLLLSIAGFFDSAYLTILHYENIIPPCTIAKGCETVLTSQFSTIFGIPIALFGSLYFLVSIFLLLLIFQKRADNFLSYFKLLSFSGVIVSVILIYIQTFVLRAFCQYCLLTEAIIFTIFILSFRLNKIPKP